MTDRDLALLCATTYNSPPPAWAFAGPTFKATALASGDALTVAIQGSDSTLDWFDDFDVVGPETFDHPDLGRIHAGFDRAVDECLPEVVRAATGRRVTLTGHSKGGATAELLAAKLVIAGIDIAGLVTFGTPRWICGDGSRVAALLPPALGVSYRFAADVVPEVPFGWAHPPTREPMRIGAVPGSLLRDAAALRTMHQIGSYVGALP